MDLLKNQRFANTIQAPAKQVQYYSQHEDPVDKLREHVKVTVNDGLALCKVLINDPWANVAETLANTKEMKNELNLKAKQRFNPIKFYNSLGISDPEAFHRELLDHSLNVTTKMYTDFALQKKVLSEVKFQNYIEKHLAKYHHNQIFDTKIKDQPVGKAQLLPPIRPPVVKSTDNKTVAKSASPVQQKPMLRKIVEQPLVQSSMPALKPIKSEMPELRVANDMPKLTPITQKETDDDDLEIIDEEIGGPKDYYYALKKDRAERKEAKHAKKKAEAEAKQEERKKRKAMKSEWPGVDLVQYSKATQQTPQTKPATSTPVTSSSDKAVSWLREGVQNKKIQLKEGASYVLFAPLDETLSQLENHYTSGKAGPGVNLAKDAVIKHHLALGVHQDSQFTTMTGLQVQKEKLNITAPTKTTVLVAGNNSLKRVAIGTSFVTIMPHGSIFPK